MAMQMLESAAVSRVLVVDDDETILELHARVLENDGHEVTKARNGAAALAAVASRKFDVVLADLDMPQLNGLALLKGIRGVDLDVPFIVITGAPSTRTAIEALEKGALRYLVKPVQFAALRKVVTDALHLHQIARAKRMALDLAGGEARLLSDASGLSARLSSALASCHIAFQPIVSWSGRRVFGYEALLRSSEPSLCRPDAILDAAERLGRIEDVGAAVRREAAAAFSRAEPDVDLFVNLHPAELQDETLYSRDNPLFAIARRVVLEITERASLSDLDNVRERVARLRALGYRIALDDLGAGYAGLTSFALLEPEVVKLDMSLIREVHTSGTRMTLARTMISMAKELGLTTIAEGIETSQERDALVKMGCDLLQGYLFCRPGPLPQQPTF